MLIIGGTRRLGGKSLYCSLNFPVNLKLPPKIIFFFFFKANPQDFPSNFRIFSIFRITDPSPKTTVILHIPVSHSAPGLSLALWMNFSTYTFSSSSNGRYASCLHLVFPFSACPTCCRQMNLPEMPPWSYPSPGPTPFSVHLSHLTFSIICTGSL